MGFESAVQRVSELRALIGIDTPESAGAGASPNAGAFQSQLMQQQALLAGGASTGEQDASASLFGDGSIPVLSVADQYRMLGIDPRMIGAPGGLLGGASGNVGQRMVQLAQQELGVSETSGNNESPRIREYRTATAGAEGTPGPWCAYFVSWLAKEAGAPIGASGNGTGYVPTLQAWGKQTNRYFEFGAQQPQPGDIVIFDWGSRGTADHTGIVERVGQDGTIHTIEGNSSDRVQRRSYSASTNDIAGYVRAGS
jgi:uncharacterized protein (TIGR02594 family)